MDGWDHEQVVNDVNSRAVINALMTRPLVQPGFTDSISQSNAYPISFDLDPTSAQPNTAAGNQGEPVDSPSSPPLSVPSAATSAPIPY